MSAGRAIAVLGLLAATGVQAQGSTEPGAWCDRVLPLETVRDVLGPEAARVERRATGVVPEGEGRCNRIYSIGRDPFSDELILLVSGARNSVVARRSLDRIAADVLDPFSLERPAGIGDAAVHYRANDPLRRAAFHTNVSFAVGDRVFELTYINVDDGQDNTFVFNSEQMLALARRIAEAAR